MAEGNNRRDGEILSGEPPANPRPPFPQHFISSTIFCGTSPSQCTILQLLTDYLGFCSRVLT